ncbi:MAG: DNA primase, partial [Pseudomonadota bacterium]
MALPPGFLDELRDRVSIAQIVGRKVSWDMRKSNQPKGDWWAPCPFHQEKTASFHVEDRKGYYYCFGCHAKGDAIAFLRELEGMSFMEAVEEMARVAGMEMPAPDPRATAQAKARASLTDVMDRAVRHFRRQLDTAAGAEARGYLEQRGLPSDAVERFEIGFAPPGWDGLRDALTGGGAEIDQLLACGLVRPSDKGRAPYDTFRNRIMFPIRDARGRAIAFGGRAMDPGDSAKYLNSPDTELFDKGRTLYHHGPARAACGKGAALIVAEGYMDVIALTRAGFEGAVAPLGTAVTEAQLKMLWQIHPEPMVALDGDAAGLRAGHRLMDLALPLMEAGQSLRFALLPPGQDPDDLIRAGGPQAMQAVLDAAVPMVELLWRRATEGRVLDSPERRAAFEKDLRGAIARIGDASIRSHYGHALREKRAELFGLGAPQPAARGPQARPHAR